MKERGSRSQDTEYITPIGSMKAASEFIGGFDVGD